MSNQAPNAEGILRDRLARGDIDATEFEHRLAVLRQVPRRPRGSRRILPVIATVLVLLAGLSVGAWAMSRNHAGWSTSACTVPSLPGSVDNVTLADMGSMMGGGMMGGMMRVVDQPARADMPAGEVSFRVVNVGSLTHELIVLSLPPGGAGSRAIGTDGRVDEVGQSRRGFDDVRRRCWRGHRPWSRGLAYAASRGGSL